MPQNIPSLRERFRFQSATLAPKDGEPLHVPRFSGTEGFSQLFAFDISLATLARHASTRPQISYPPFWAFPPCNLKSLNCFTLHMGRG